MRVAAIPRSADSALGEARLPGRASASLERRQQELIRWVNRQLDRAAHAGLWRRLHTPYRFFVLLGAFAALACVGLLALGTGLDTGIALGAVAAGALAALLMAWATKALSGQESYVLYHYQLLFILTVGVCLWLGGLPVLPYLDVAALGLAVAQSIGRIGCQLAGCCHGRPSRVGAPYCAWNGSQAADPVWNEVRMLPIPAIELLLTSVLTASLALHLVASQPAPGSILATYLTGYAVVRFGLEFLRGDARRRYWIGLSEAQWTALAVAGLVAAAGWPNALPGHSAHLAAAFVLGLVTAVRVADRRKHELLAARHLRDLMTVLNATRARAASEGGGFVDDTSQGVRLSASFIAGAGRGSLISFSRPAAHLGEKLAARLAGVLRLLVPDGDKLTLVGGDRGVYHLVSRDRGDN